MATAPCTGACDIPGAFAATAPCTGAHNIMDTFYGHSSVHWCMPHFRHFLQPQLNALVRMILQPLFVAGAPCDFQGCSCLGLGSKALKLLWQKGFLVVWQDLGQALGGRQAWSALFDTFCWTLHSKKYGAHRASDTLFPSTNVACQDILCQMTICVILDEFLSCALLFFEGSF